MSQVKHTPGPWRVRKCDGGYRLFDRDDWAIVSEGCITPCLVWGGSAFEEGAANARLIAAAPELLEALRAMRQAFSAFRAVPVGAPGSCARAEQDDQIAAEDKAIAAIAKAIGE